MVTFNFTINIFNVSSVHQIIATCTNIGMVDLTFGHVTEIVSGLHVVVNQLITVVIDIRVIGTAYLLCR